MRPLSPHLSFLHHHPIASIGKLHSTLLVTAMPDHPIFDEIRRGDLEAVKQHVLADPAVLEEKQEAVYDQTPLIYAIHCREVAIAHWLIDHRGQLDVNTRDGLPSTALHHAYFYGGLSVVKALVASGADPAVTNGHLMTPSTLLISTAVLFSIALSSGAASPPCSSSSMQAPAPPSLKATCHPSTSPFKAATYTLPSLPSSASPSPSPTAPAPSTRPAPSSMPA